MGLCLFIFLFFFCFRENKYERFIFWNKNDFFQTSTFYNGAVIFYFLRWGSSHISHCRDFVSWFRLFEVHFLNSAFLAGQKIFGDTVNPRHTMAMCNRPYTFYSKNCWFIILNICNFHVNLTGGIVQNIMCSFFCWLVSVLSSVERTLSFYGWSL